MNPEPRDDVDELFSRLQEVAPPDNLVRQVLARTVEAQAPARRLRLGLIWGLLDLVALVLLTALSFSLGFALNESGSFELLRLGLENLEVLIDARADFLPAVVEALPWWHLAALALNLAAVYGLSRILVGNLLGQAGAMESGVGVR